MYFLEGIEHCGYMQTSEWEREMRETKTYKFNTILELKRFQVQKGKRVACRTLAEGNLSAAKRILPLSPLLYMFRKYKHNKYALE